MKKLGLNNTFIYVSLIFLTLHGFYILESPNVTMIKSFVSNGLIYQVRTVSLDYYRWNAFYYIYTYSYLIYLMYVIFELSNNSIVKIMCMTIGLFIFGLLVFNLRGVIDINYLIEATQRNINELLFGGLAIILLLMFLIFRR